MFAFTFGAFSDGNRTIAAVAHVACHSLYWTRGRILSCKLNGRYNSICSSTKRSLHFPFIVTVGIAYSYNRIVSSAQAILCRAHLVQNMPTHIEANKDGVLRCYYPQVSAESRLSSAPSVSHYSFPSYIGKMPRQLTLKIGAIFHQIVAHAKHDPDM